MSDPYGRHGCNEAKNVEINGQCTCNITGHEVMCGGYVEECILDPIILAKHEQQGG